jgi:hypothetical protein
MADTPGIGTHGAGSEWIDYLHPAKFNRELRIVNVLWQNDPPVRRQSDEEACAALEEK